MAAKLKAAVAGATGYAGGELLRILAGHPDVEPVFACASQAKGPVHETHPNLRGFVDLVIEAMPRSASGWGEVDVVFLALPHGESAGAAALCPPGAKLVDLAADHRHAEGFVYGLCELNRTAIKGAPRVANPGCFASAAILGLAPLVVAGLLEPGSGVVVDGKTGSSGSGAKPSAGTHHPQRSTSLYAYKSFKHQHQPEIQAALAAASPAWTGPVTLHTHSTPLVRGIYASIYGTLRDGVSDAAIDAAFRELYEAAPFVRLLPEPPNAHWVRGTNFTDVSWARDGRQVAVFAALDNLGKGAAGQAVQNMNLMLGLDEKAGLWQAGACP